MTPDRIPASDAPAPPHRSIMRDIPAWVEEQAALAASPAQEATPPREEQHQGWTKNDQPQEPRLPQSNHNPLGEFPMAKGEWQTLSPAEKSRTYTYAAGEVLRYDDVTRVKVSESGTHYLETASGRKAIVAPGWRSVELDMEAWTF